ncbi:hypothetical protein BJY01DRAFT_256432 [Aspergillus pseudoustus]|uniref:Lactonase, 7-bladed beta-propeller-domain-containing protein n=1 Tax=Aspergillus pseudoustus TaxID=1810923 RepID=A0ABR4ICV3_9EURO
MKPQHVLAASLPLSLASPNPNVVSIPAEYTYLLPAGFQGNLTQDFILTEVDNPEISSLFAQAQSAPFVSYSTEFTNLIGSATLEPIVGANDTDFPFSWAGEAGIWLPDLNQVWCTGTYNRPVSLYIISLDTNTVTQFDGPLAGPAGGYYFNGTVYVALTGDAEGAAAVVAIDPHTHKITPVVNSYFGLELPPVDDLVVTYSGGNQHIVRISSPAVPGHPSYTAANPWSNGDGHEVVLYHALAGHFRYRHWPRRRRAPQRSLEIQSGISQPGASDPACRCLLTQWHRR